MASQPTDSALEPEGTEPAPGSHGLDFPPQDRETNSETSPLPSDKTTASADDQDSEPGLVQPNLPEKGAQKDDAHNPQEQPKDTAESSEVTPSQQSEGRDGVSNLTVQVPVTPPSKNDGGPTESGDSRRRELLSSLVSEGVVSPDVLYQLLSLIIERQDSVKSKEPDSIARRQDLLASLIFGGAIVPDVLHKLLTDIVQTQDAPPSAEPQVAGPAQQRASPGPASGKAVPKASPLGFVRPRAVTTTVSVLKATSTSPLPSSPLLEGRKSLEQKVSDLELALIEAKGRALTSSDSVHVSLKEANGKIKTLNDAAIVQDKRFKELKKSLEKMEKTEHTHYEDVLEKIGETHESLDKTNLQVTDLTERNDGLDRHITNVFSQLEQLHSDSISTGISISNIQENILAVMASTQDSIKQNKEHLDKELELLNGLLRHQTEALRTTDARHEELVKIVDDVMEDYTTKLLLQSHVRELKDLIEEAELRLDRADSGISSNLEDFRTEMKDVEKELTDVDRALATECAAVETRLNAARTTLAADLRSEAKETTSRLDGELAVVNAQLTDHDSRLVVLVERLDNANALGSQHSEELLGLSETIIRDRSEADLSLEDVMKKIDRRIEFLEFVGTSVDDLRHLPPSDALEMAKLNMKVLYTKRELATVQEFQKTVKQKLADAEAVWQPVRDGMLSKADAAALESVRESVVSMTKSLRSEIENSNAQIAKCDNRLDNFGDVKADRTELELVDMARKKYEHDSTFVFQTVETMLKKLERLSAKHVQESAITSTMLVDRISDLASEKVAMSDVVPVVQKIVNNSGPIGPKKEVVCLSCRPNARPHSASGTETSYVQQMRQRQRY